MSNHTNVNPQQANEDMLETATILGVTPDEAASMSLTEIAAAMLALKDEENNRNISSDILADSSRIA